MTSKLKVIEDTTDEPVSIIKPSCKFDPRKFVSKRGAAVAVEVLPTALPVLKLSEAKDFVMLHPDEENFWSSELCFVNVPAKGQKKDLLHLIDDDLAALTIPRKPLLRFRLALATKPYDIQFLAIVPSNNLDNDWNASNLRACEAAKAQWIEVFSLREENREGYGFSLAENQDAFPSPNWGTQNIWDSIGITFDGRAIEDANSDALKRLRGAKISVA